MTHVNDNDDDGQDDWVERGMADALAELFRDWEGPLVAEETLLAGAVRGFGEDDAEAILMDRESIAWLNARWNSYEDATDQDLPAGLLTRLAEERRYGGPQWNLRIAHAAGHGWSDSDADEALFALITQEMSSAAFSEDVRVLALSRGEQTGDSGDSEPWEIYFRSQHFLVLVRQDAEVLVVEVLSGSKSGLFELTLRWSNGSRSTHSIQVRAGEATRLEIDSQSKGLPISASVRVAP